MRPENESKVSTASRRATIGTLAVLTGLLTLHGCDSAGPIDQAAEHAAQQAKEPAAGMDGGTAAGPDPAAVQPGSAPAEAEKEDPPKP